MKQGDYVVATKYRSGDPQDHFCVGWYAFFKEDSQRHMVADSNGDWFRASGFRRVKKISSDCGEWLVHNLKAIESSGQSVWHFVKFWRRYPAELL